MARGMNQVNLVGNLTRDPELKFDKNNKPYAKLDLAINEPKKISEDEWGEHTEFVRVAVFGKTAENCAEFLSKGRQVIVSDGRMRTSKYTDKDGVERYGTEVTNGTIIFGQGGKPADNG